CRRECLNVYIGTLKDIRRHAVVHFEHRFHHGFDFDGLQFEIHGNRLRPFDDRLHGIRHPVYIHVCHSFDKKCFSRVLPFLTIIQLYTFYPRFQVFDSFSNRINLYYILGILGGLTLDIILIIKYVFLGLLQGITEPIPVSSSGHLVIARELFHIEARGLSFEIFLNTASLLAILFVYMRDILAILSNLYRYIFRRARYEEAVKDFKYTMYLIIATIPVGILGVLLKNVIGDNISMRFFGVMLLVTG